MSDMVIVDRVGSAQVITINRPYARNSVNPELREIGRAHV